MVEDVIYRDSVWKPSRTLYDKPIPILTNKDASAHLIIPVAHSIQNRLPDYPLVECRDVIDEESLLVMPLIISQINGFPQAIIAGKKSHLEFFPLICGA